MAPKGSTEGLGGRLTSLAAGCCDCPCTSLGYYGTPTLVHRQEPPGLGHTRCRALLGQAQNRARARAAWVTPHLTPHPPRPPRMARVNCGVVGEIVGGFFIRKGEMSAPSLLISRGNRGSSRLPHKRREAWRRGFRGVHSPRSRGGERSPHPSSQFCTPATRLPCAWGGERWRRETGPSWAEAAGRSQFPAPSLS